MTCTMLMASMIHSTWLCLPDVGSSKSGYYELQAVLTHKGRSSSSGHYVAWVRRKDGQCLKQGNFFL